MLSLQLNRKSKNLRPVAVLSKAFLPYYIHPHPKIFYVAYVELYTSTSISSLLSLFKKIKLGS
jgi:hypothetical protein